MREFGIERVEIKDPFWLRYGKLIREEMLPYQWQVLNDQADIVIEKERDADYIPADKSHAIENFKIAAGFEEGSHYGMVFQDSDVYKWLEAVAYSLQQSYDASLKELADGVIDLIAAAQEEDGYLNTYFTVEAPTRKFKRLYQSHELYCAGHYIEAAVAYYDAVGSDKALAVACSLADCIDAHFGVDSGKIKGYDGHEEIELALLRLYEVTGEKRYMELSHFFLYERGQDPTFFRKQVEADPDKSVLIEGMEGFSAKYYQVHKPLLEQDTAEGHAVRVVYLCTSMAKLAHLNHDEKILEACRRLWKNIVTKRLYITGAIGSTVTGEAFTADYDLPNDTMYGETCASIGLIFFAKEMLQNEIKGEYADVMEKALYNTVISGMALDGKHFFYVNPLEVVPEYSRKDPGKSHVKLTRPAWFGCSCCPPNLARLLTSLNHYAYTVKDTAVYTDLYMSCEAEFSIAGQTVGISQKTDYPWNGSVHFSLNADGEKSFGFGIRIPSWAKNYCLKVNGEICSNPIKNGFVLIERQWRTGDEVELELDMSVRFWEANPKVREDLHRVAVQRGPIVYCAESFDNGEGLQLLHVSDETKFSYVFDETKFGGAGILQGIAGKLKIQETWQKDLYRPAEMAEFEPMTITLIPYFCWANRGENEMLVWLHKK